MKMTLCCKTINGDVPSVEIKESEDALSHYYDWLKKVDLDKSVLVFFLSWLNDEDDFRNEHNHFIITHISDYISEAVEHYVENIYNEHSDLVIFEFESYEDAFGYCRDLKEGF